MQLGQLDDNMRTARATRFGRAQGFGKILEYGGEAVRALSVDERATLTNMAAEVGAFTGIVAPDGRTAELLVERRGMNRYEAEGLVAAGEAAVTRNMP